MSSPPPPPSSKPSGFNSLPNELLLTILGQSPDISTLWSLINSSARLAALFQARALETVEAVLEATVPLQSRILMRAVLSLRAGTSPCQDYYDAMDYLVEKDGPWPPVVATADIVREFVRFAHQVHLLAHWCLDSCLEHCLSRPLLARRQYSPTFRQPTWTEEQRTILAVWRHVWYQSLQRAGRQGSLEWSPADLDRLATVTPFEYPIPSSGIYQVLTVIDFLARHAAAGSDSTTGLGLVLPDIPAHLRFGWPCAPAPYASALAQDADGLSTAIKPDEGALQLEGKLDEEREKALATEIAQAAAPSAPPPEDECRPWPPGYVFQPVRDYGVRPPAREWQDLDAEPLGFQFWRSMIHNPLGGRGKYMALRAYLPYGLVLWEEQRITAMGLWSPLGDPCDYYRRWYALLSEEEIQQHKSSLPFCGDTEY
ncbi:hypothetical protein BO86DRAFT_443396 [Aspergillus japonicus CBS 114.51]|uniref:F-box domain-containing protein n=1 Tax=Aspergillus japonicus CBS 114.51 TaxID=1448312 RepID=A0A8T8WKY6_ASPJA|nr:hypothetical protein BO86DRAFT_443396 [Aspergillus japonicus CBS 114.51]RAH76508.1 hypothetical protein BO86DRAFT_443396 [Aspergillus japonicus CBS 114.51]